MANEVRVVVTAEDKASPTLDKIGTKLDKGLKAGALAAGAAVVGIGTASVIASSNFQTAFAEVTTLFDLPQQQIATLRADVLGLSKEMGVDATEATKALYQAISAGQEPAAAVDFLRNSIKLAVGGVTDLTTAVDLNTTILNAWQLSNSELQRVQDTLFTTVRLGKTTVDELGQAFFNVAPIAAAANIPIEQVGAALATLTASGIRTAEATTKLRELISSLAAPTKEVAARQEELNIKFEEGEISAIGLDEALRRVNEATGGNLELTRQVLGSQEAMSAALVLGGKGADAFAAGLDAMEGKTGSADEAFEKMNATFGRQFDILKASLGVALIEIGDIILPAVTRAIQNLTLALSDKLPGAIAKMQSEFNKWTPVAVEAGRVAAELGKALQSMGEWIINNQAALIAAITAIGIALAIFHPGALIFIGIGLLIVAFTDFGSKMDETGETALRLKLKMLKMKETLLDTIVTVELLGLNKLPGLGDKLVDVAAKTGVFTGGLGVSTDALLSTRAEVVALEARLLPLAKTSQLTDLVVRAMALGFTEAEIRAGTAGGMFSFMRQATFALNVSMVQSGAIAPSVAMAYRQIAIAALDAGVTVEVMAARMRIAARVMAIAAATIALSRSTIQDFGANVVDFVKALSQIPKIIADIDAATAGGGGGGGAAPPVPSASSILGGAGGGVGASPTAVAAEIEEEINLVGIAWGKAAAIWMEAVENAINDGTLRIEDTFAILANLGTDAFMSTLAVFAKIEQESEEVARIIASTIESGVIRVQDIMRLFDLGKAGAEAAQDFLDALHGKASDIGDAIFDKVGDAAQLAAQAAAVAFVEAFEQGAQDIADIIASIPSTLQGITSQQTLEDAQARGRILLKQLEIMELQAAAAADAEARAARVLVMEEELVAAREDGAERIARAEQQIADERARIVDLRDLVQGMRDDAAAAAAILSGENLPGQRTLTDIANDIMNARDLLEEGEGSRARAMAREELARLEEEFDTLGQAIEDDIAAKEEEIATGEAQIDTAQARLDAFKAAHEAGIAAMEELIEAERGLGSETEKRIEQLQEEIAALELVGRRQDMINELRLIEAQIRNDLLPTNEEMLQQLDEQIALLQQLNQVFEDMANGIFTVDQAFILLQAGLEDLAAAVLLIVAGILDPALADVGGFAQTASFSGTSRARIGPDGIMEVAPEFIGGGKPIRDAPIYIEHVTVTGDRLEALSALGVIVK